MRAWAAAVRPYSSIVSYSLAGLDQADFLALSQSSILEELALNRLIVTCCLPPGDKALGDLMPAGLAERSEGWRARSVGLMLSELKLATKNCKDIFRRLRMGNEGADASAHYSMVSALHLSGADLGRDGLAMLSELLISQTCTVNSLDLSYTQFDGYSLLQSLRSNGSITSLDVRKVAGMDKLYQTLSDMLLQEGGKCRLGCLRCDAFDVLEGARVLSFNEHLLDASEMLMLIGLMKHNRFARELDLTATDMGPSSAKTLAGVLRVNTMLTVVKISFNSALTAEAKDALRAAAEARADLKLEL